MNTHRLLFVTVALITSLCCTMSTGLAMNSSDKSSVAEDEDSYCTGCWKSCFNVVEEELIEEFPSVFSALGKMVDFLSNFQKKHPVAFKVLVKLAHNKEVVEMTDPIKEVLIGCGFLNNDGSLNSVMQSAVTELVHISASKRGHGDAEPIMRVISMEEYQLNMKQKNDDATI